MTEIIPANPLCLGALASVRKFCHGMNSVCPEAAGGAASVPAAGLPAYLQSTRSVVMKKLGGW